MTFALLLIALVFMSFILIKATEIVLNSMRQISTSIGVDKFGITAFALALATSFPELFVGITAAIRGDPELSLGNVIGSNIANLSLVMGGAALISGSVKANDRFINIEVFHTFLAGALPLLLLLDRKLTRLDGLVLITVYLLYNLTVLQVKKKQLVKQHQKVGAVWWRRVWFKVSDAHMEKATGMFFMGMALLILASDMLVRIAERIAVILNLPTIIIGMILIAVGTSLPELSFEIAAIRKKEVEMALGNILGSVVANSTLILGVTVLLSPITLNDGIRPYLVATLSFITAFSLFWIFVRSKKQLDRWEGLILLLVFLLFVVFEFFKLQNGFSF